LASLPACRRRLAIPARPLQTNLTCFVITGNAAEKTPLACGDRENPMTGDETMAAADWRVPSDEGIRNLLIERLDRERQGVGIVVGVIDGQGRRVVAHGALGEADSRTLDGDSVFEIGSITKVFTTLVLADMVERGEVALDDAVASSLPAGVTTPERGGRRITLIDLATHASGLPRRPIDMAPADWANPYADYSVDQLYAFLGRYELRRDIGAAHLYSNLGMGLLGHALALRAGVDFESLVRQRITGPLGLTETAIALSPGMRMRLAVGHDAERRPVANWDFAALAGAGALRSTANDLLGFLAAELGQTTTPLKAAMAAQTAPRRPTDEADERTLGWLIAKDSVGEIVWHGGATAGYRCFLLFNRARDAGVVMLTNCATTRNDDIPFHLLSGRPLSPPPAPRVAIRLEPELLDRYVGRYRVSPVLELVVSRDGERVFAQMSRQEPFEVLADSPTSFFWRLVDARMTVELDPDGAVTGLVLHQNGRDLPAARVG
jgi:D-alanyl-D-alanine-carboxypeptidase/D-alanyl-D-alanine-endopeptidase